jgi:hypothetical protein
MLLPISEKNPETPLLDVDFFAAGFFLETAASGGGVLATVAAGAGAVTTGEAVPAVVPLDVAPVVDPVAVPVMSGFTWGVPSTVPGVEVLGAGVGAGVEVTVPDVVVEGVLVVEGVVVGVTVPAGVRVDGVVTAGAGAAGEFDTQLTVTDTPSTTALLDRVTTEFCVVV